VTGEVSIRPADARDASALTAIATAAYAPYIERIGREPAPMVADFAAHVARGEAWVLEDAAEVVAFIITYPKSDGQFIENVAVRPSRHGQGHGRSLMDYAEFLAREQGFQKLELYTNVKMAENLAFYPKLGYVETKRISEDGFDRVYFEKRLDP